jgi:hypothetical protein
LLLGAVWSNSHPNLYQLVLLRVVQYVRLRITQTSHFLSLATAFAVALLCLSASVGAQPRQAEKKPVVRTIAPGTKVKVLDLRSKQEGSRGTFTLDVDLGSMYVEAAKQRVVGGEAIQFDEINWSRLTQQGLPNGASILPMGQAGQPEVPYLVVALALPAGAADVKVERSIKRQSSHRDISLLPAPRRLNDTTSVREYDHASYTAPLTQRIETKGPMRMRQLTMVHVQVPLMEYDAADRTARVSESFALNVSYTAPGTAAGTRAAFTDHAFNQVYDNLVLNTQDIARFAAPFKRTGKGARAQAFDESVISWIDQSAPYVKLTVNRDGLYRVTAQQLSNSSGINVSEWQGDDVRLINRGVEVYAWVEKDNSGRLTAIEFYGQHLRGHGREKYNYETDNNAYWLTTSSKTGGSPKRYLQKTSSGGQVVNEGVIALHHERDFNIYEGAIGERTDLFTSHRTQWIPGERWYWDALKPTESLRDTFYLASLPQDAGNKFVAFSFAVHGISYEENVFDNHRVSIKLNGVEVDNFKFSRYDSIGKTLQIQSSLLQSGANIVEFESLGTDALNDLFYVDYYRAEIRTSLTPSIDTAIARGQFDFTVDVGLQGHSIQASAPTDYVFYNLTDGTRISGERAGSTITIEDQSSTTQPRYVGASVTSFLAPFRIEGLNKDGNLSKALNKSNGADYIVLTHPKFLEQANRLTFRREQAGLRSMVITTDEIFNTFSFGSEESWSIRRFLDYAYHNYDGNPAAFVTLFGDASWDPKFNRTNLDVLNGLTAEVSRHASYVPTYGMPVSDFIYTTVDGEGIDSIIPEMIISRIPVESTEDADVFISKLIEYESRPAEAWNREFMFVIGGDGPWPRSGEHDGFVGQVRTYIEEPVGSPLYQGGLKYPPMNINSTRVLRQVFEFTDVTQIPTIQNEFRRGKSLVHFAGHGATFITDVMFGEPHLYRNQGLYPVFVTLSCRTGAFGEPYSVTLNEAFLRQAGGGVIMSYGTTGFGEPIYDYYLSGYFFKMFRDDTLFQSVTYDPSKLNIASMLTGAQVLASLASDGNIAENSRLQYTILGDAAMGFAFRPRPEFHIEASDVILSSKDNEGRTTFEAEEGEFNVRAIIRNFGYSAETPVVIRIRDESGNVLEVRDTLSRLDVVDTIDLSLPLDTNRLGQHTLRITIDPEQQFPESNDDNEVAISFLVNGQSARPIFPFDAARAMCGINGDSVLIRVLVPERKFVQGRDRLEIEFDTTSRFTDPRTFSSVTSSFPTISNTFLSASLPKNYQNVVYWRVRTVINGVAAQYANSSFKLDKIDAPQVHISTYDQLAAAIDVGLRVNEIDRLTIPQQDTVIYTIVAHGNDDTTVNKHPIGQIIRNGRTIYQLDFPKSGFALVELTSDGNTIAKIHEFINQPYDQIDTQTAVAKIFDSVVKAIPDGRPVIILTNLQPFVPPYFTRDSIYVRPALRSLGAEEGFDSLWYFESYAMFGRKGSAPGTAKELRAPAASSGVIISDTLISAGTSGFATTPFTATASGYKSVKWSGAFPQGTEIGFTVLGQRRDDNRIERLNSFNGSSTFEQDISGIDCNRIA